MGRENEDRVSRCHDGEETVWDEPLSPRLIVGYLEDEPREATVRGEYYPSGIFLAVVVPTRGTPDGRELVGFVVVLQEPGGLLPVRLGSIAEQRLRLLGAVLCPADDVLNTQLTDVKHQPDGERQKATDGGENPAVLKQPPVTAFGIHRYSVPGSMQKRHERRHSPLSSEDLPESHPKAVVMQIQTSMIGQDGGCGDIKRPQHDPIKGLRGHADLVIRAQTRGHVEKLQFVPAIEEPLSILDPGLVRAVVSSLTPVPQPV